MAKENYRMKVRDEIDWAINKQQELEELERKETKMLEKIKVLKCFMLDYATNIS